jgi:hypothetical protein
VPTDPREVAEVIYPAISTGSPRLRDSCSRGGTELVEGRRALSDEAWVHLGQSIDTDEYWKRFSDAFGWRVEG